MSRVHDEYVGCMKPNIDLPLYVTARVENGATPAMLCLEHKLSPSDMSAYPAAEATPGRHQLRNMDSLENAHCNWFAPEHVPGTALAI